MKGNRFTIPRWLSSAVIVLCLLGFNTSVNGQVTDNRRYLALMLTNENETYDGDELITTAHNAGYNMLYLTIRWDVIACASGDCANDPAKLDPNNWQWTQIDAQVAKAKSLNMKLAFRIHLGAVNVGQFIGQDRDRSSSLWGTSTGYVQDVNGSTTFDDVLKKKIFGFTSQGPINRAKDFVGRVINRYASDINNGNIVFTALSVTNNQEMEYPNATITDYSPEMVGQFQTWYQNNYGSNPGYPPSNFNGVIGKRWYKFRHSALKSLVDQMILHMKSVNSNVKYISDNGSVLAGASNRATLGFQSLGEYADGFKVNDANIFDHRWTMDVLRTNYSSKWIMNELGEGTNASSNFQDAQNLIETSYKHGAKVVSVLSPSVDDMKAHDSITHTIAANYLNGVNGIMPSSIATNGSVSYSVEEVIGVYYDIDRLKSTSNREIYQEWLNVYNSNPVGAKPVNVLVDESFLDGPSCPFTVVPTSSNYNPLINTSVQLQAGCSGSECGSAAYEWSRDAIVFSNSSGPTITVPAVAGQYIYTVKVTSSVCVKTASVSITVGTGEPPVGSCYTFMRAGTSKMLTMVVPSSTSIAVPKLRDIDNSDLQIWKLQESNGYFQIVANNGKILGVQNGGNSINDAVTLLAPGTSDHLLWTRTALSGSDAGRDVFVRKNSSGLRFGVVNYGSGLPDETVTDLSLASDPNNMFGANKWILQSVGCPGETTCAYSLTASSGNLTPNTGTNINLNAGCSGDCSGLTFNWIMGGNTVATTSNPTIAVSSNAGIYVYTVTATKEGCSKSSSVSITVVGQQATGDCYTFTRAGTNKLLTLVVPASTSIAVPKLRDPDNSNSQIWKLESSGSFVRVVANDGKVLGVLNGGNNVDDAVTLQPSGSADHLLWTRTALTGSDAGRDKFVRKNSNDLRFGVRFYGSGSTDESVTDLSLGYDPDNLFGANKWILQNVGCSGEPSVCDYDLTASSNNNSPNVGTSINLNAGCTGNCSGLVYNWSLSGNSVASTSNPSITVSSIPGTYVYTVTATKTGCSKSSSVTIVVGNNSVAAVCINTGGDLCPGSAVDVVTFTLPMTSVGTYGLKIKYRSFDGPSVGKIRANNGNWQTFNASQTGIIDYLEVTVNNISLISGNNTLELGMNGGFLCFGEICTTTNGGARLGYEKVSEEGTDNMSGLAIAPNPNTGEFNVSFYLKSGEKANLDIISVTGKSVYNKKIVGQGAHKENIRLGNPSSGMYLLRLRNHHELQIKKMLIVK